MEELINAFNQAKFLDDAVLKGFYVTWKMCTAILFPSIAAITIGWAFAKNWMQSFPERPKSFVPWADIVRTGFLLLMLLMYRPIVGTVGRITMAMNNGTAPDAVLLTQTNKMFEKYVDHGLAHGTDPSSYDDPDSGGESNATEETLPPPEFDWTGFFLDPSTLIASLLNGISILIITIIEMIIRIATILMSKVLFIIGPLAITFSLIPGFQSKLGEWFGSFINISLVGTTMNLIEYVVKGSFFGILKTSGMQLQVMDPITQLVFNLSIIIVYLYSFWLTAKYIGNNDGGKILSSGLQTATMMATGLIAAGGAGLMKKDAASNAMENTSKITKDLSE